MSNDTTPATDDGLTGYQRDRSREREIEWIKEQERGAAIEKQRGAAIREMLDEFPLTPMGDRVILMRKLPEHVSSGEHGAKILLVRDESLVPLVGWVVAVPDHEDPTRKIDPCPFKVGDEVSYPDHAFSPIKLDLLGD
ncbi:MAG TPA: hypothetical protein VMX57_08515, partial [Planctomycetota bacterium]|nr:hypothetical protein [Planctomycetota bacterium]